MLINNAKVNKPIAVACLMLFNPNIYRKMVFKLIAKHLILHVIQKFVSLINKYYKFILNIIQLIINKCFTYCHSSLIYPLHKNTI